MEGTLKIDLKGTEVVVEEPKNWFQKIFVGKKEYEKEAATQFQYLEKIYKIFSDLGWKNIVSLEVNSETVYEDEEYKEDDFREAVEKAYEKVEEKDFDVVIKLENTEGGKEDTLSVDFASKHDVGEYPLEVEVSLEKSSEEVNTFLTGVKEKVNEVFGVESGDIEVGDDDEEDEEEEESEKEADEVAQKAEDSDKDKEE